jgi:Double zinc ribbon
LPLWRRQADGTRTAPPPLVTAFSTCAVPRAAQAQPSARVLVTTSGAQCPCGHENAEGAKFCVACGASLAAVCHPCGQRNPRDARYCNYCGVPLPSDDGKGSPVA